MPTSRCSLINSTCMTWRIFLSSAESGSSRSSTRGLRIRARASATPLPLPARKRVRRPRAEIAQTHHLQRLAHRAALVLGAHLGLAQAEAHVLRQP